MYAQAQHADPTKPLLVWMNGGPGASSLVGMFTELGPLLLNSRSRPSANAAATTTTNATATAIARADAWTLFANPYAWSNEASLLVWEQPAGVGFSRCVTSVVNNRGKDREEQEEQEEESNGGDDAACPTWDDESSSAANLRLLLAFYGAFPEALSRRLFLSGESYAGVYVPLLAQQVHLHNTRVRVRSRSSSSNSGDSTNHNSNATRPVQASAAATHDDNDGAATTTVEIPLKGILVGNGCVGYDAEGGCGRDTLRILLTVLEQGAPGLNRSAIDSAFSTCGDAELDKDVQSADELAPACRRVRAVPCRAVPQCSAMQCRGHFRRRAVRGRAMQRFCWRLHGCTVRWVFRGGGGAGGRGDGAQ
jgi:hypothetical protein